MTEQDYIDIILFIEKKTGEKVQVYRTFPNLWASFGLACELQMPSSIASSTAHISSGHGFAEQGAPTEQELQREVKCFVEKLEKARSEESKNVYCGEHGDNSDWQGLPNG